MASEHNKTLFNQKEFIDYAQFPMSHLPEFVFVGSGFAAKYPEGGGNFSVPMQWVLGLKRLHKKFAWLEILEGSGNVPEDRQKIQIFEQRMRQAGLERNYCLLFQEDPEKEAALETMSCHGIEANALQNLLEGPNVLLNLAYSVRPPLLEHFERRILCDLDPGEIPYWMTQIEVGQSSHHEFWTIGLNIGRRGCRLPPQTVSWKTFFPLVDTELNQPVPRPAVPKFTTVGQWYWKNNILVDGKWRDFSKGASFEKFLDLPRQVPKAHMELAMHMPENDPEKQRLQELGWIVVNPHRVARSPNAYRKYLAGALAEFTVVKGIDTYWQTGWISDRAATFLAMGRPVVTEDTGAKLYLPANSGMLFPTNLKEAAEAIRYVMRDWDFLSKKARECAVECFDSVKTLRRILEGCT